jgi:general secretion pathway protein I
MSAARAERRGPGARPAGARAFTLLEVMVALAILAGALMALSDVVGGALRNHVRAQQLEVATLLARGKMVALEEGFERTGFRDFDETEEGTFEEEGHPDVRWKAEVVKPEVDLSAAKILEMLTGTEDLSQLIPGAAGEDGTTVLDPRAGALSAIVQTQLTAFGEQVKKGVREVRLTVSWGDGPAEQSFTVVTHLVVLQPKELG